MEKTAAVHTRKDLERQLEKVRKDLNDARTKHEAASSQLSSVQKVADEAHKQMSSAKEMLKQLMDHIHDMDLSGAHSVKDRGDMRTYLVGNKEYHLDKSNADDMKLVPWKEFKSTKEPKKEDQHSDDDDSDDNYAFDVGYSFASAFNLLKK